jgi:multisubunit Na+/H+ antiporter MnhB subunit
VITRAAAVTRSLPVLALAVANLVLGLRDQGRPGDVSFFAGAVVGVSLTALLLGFRRMRDWKHLTLVAVGVALGALLFVVGSDLVVASTGCACSGA